jgi:DNA-binding NtrC family response regulator
MSSNIIESMILVVDDSPETVELIKRNLESKGYRVVTADNVQTAIKILQVMPIDMVVTDLKMPGESGLTLVRHVSENYKHIGVLVVTGFPSIQGAVESIKIGAEEYLVKSFTDKELFEAVERVLAKRPRSSASSSGLRMVFSTRNNPRDAPNVSSHARGWEGSV